MPDPTPLELAVAEWETARANATAALASFYVAVSALRDSHLRAQALGEGVGVPTMDPIEGQFAVIGACDEAAWIAAAETNGSTQPWATFRLQHVIRIPYPPTGD